MSDTPRTDAAYDRAEETVSKFRREDLRKQAEIDELDKECRQLERELAEAKEAEASEARWAAQYKQERDNALSDYKQADTDSIRSLHERNLEQRLAACREALEEIQRHTHCPLSSDIAQAVLDLTKP